MAKIAIEIENCSKCPHWKEANPWSSDGWDRMIDWICGKTNMKIQGSVEWHEEKSIPIPDWCPLLIHKVK